MYPNKHVSKGEILGGIGVRVAKIAEEIEVGRNIFVPVPKAQLR